MLETTGRNCVYVSNETRIQQVRNKLHVKNQARLTFRLMCFHFNSGLFLIEC